MASPPDEEFPRRGEVHWVDFGTPRGSERGGRRPAVIVSNDVANEHSTVVIVAAITSRVPSRRYRWNVHLPSGVAGMTMEGTIFCNQLRTVDKERLDGQIGRLDDQRVRWVLRWPSVSDWFASERGVKPRPAWGISR